MNSFVNIISEKKVYIDKVLIFLLHIFILVIPFSTALSRTSSILVFLFWLFSSYYINFKTVLEEFPIFKYIIVFVTYILISLFWSDSVNAGIKEIEDYIYWIVLVPFATIVTKYNYKYFLYSFIFASFISLFISYGLQFNIIHPINKFPIYWFLDSIDYSIYLCLSSLSLFYLILTLKSSTTSKIILIAIFLITVNMLLESDGRTGQYSFFIGMLYFLFQYFDVNKKIKIISSVMFVLLVFGAYAFNDSAQKRFLSAINDIKILINKDNYNSSLGIRYVTAKIALDSSSQKPLFGHGIGDDYQEYITLIQTKYKKYNKFLMTDEKLIKYRPHSQYAFVSYRLGLVGFVLFLLLLYKMYSLNTLETEYNKLFTSIMLVLTFSMLFNNILKSTLTTAMFLVFIGIAIGLSRKNIHS